MRKITMFLHEDQIMSHPHTIIVPERDAISLRQNHKCEQCMQLALFNVYLISGKLNPADTLKKLKKL